MCINFQKIYCTAAAIQWLDVAFFVISSFRQIISTFFNTKNYNIQEQTNKHLKLVLSTKKTK